MPAPVINAVAPVFNAAALVFNAAALVINVFAPVFNAGAPVFNAGVLDPAPQPLGHGTSPLHAPVGATPTEPRADQSAAALGHAGTILFRCAGGSGRPPHPGPGPIAAESLSPQSYGSLPRRIKSRAFTDC